jgi:exosortase H (IPTLxxWG-CTERM-specific)
MTDNRGMNNGRNNARGTGRRALVRMYAIFAVTLVTLFTVTMIKPVYFRVIIPFNQFLAWSSTAMIRTMGSESVTSSGALVSQAGFSINIAEGCNGIYALAIVMAGMVAIPAPWRPKSLGLLLAIIFIMFLNYVRIIVLWYAGIYFPTLFEAMHLYIWEFVIIALGAWFWYFWYEKFVATS